MKYDVVIIGGGPAGMMSAIRASELGARVVLVEKNNTPGAKLLITGKGRCNITNNTKNQKEVIKQYGEKGKFLFSSIFSFDTQDVIIFFNNLGVKTKTERGNRVFPVSDESQEVLQSLLKKIQNNKVEIKTNSAVKELVEKKKEIEKIVLFDGSEIYADKFIIATGGKSYPATGSTGDAYRWLKKLGHTIIDPRPVLTPIVCQEKFTQRLEGLSLKNVKITLLKNNKKVDSEFGEAIFTKQGMSGPVILNLSKNIIDVRKNKYELEINFKPAIDSQSLDKRIVRDFQKFNNKQFKNSLVDLLPKKLIPIILELSGVNLLKQVNLITKEERKKILQLLTNFKLTIKGTAGFEKAIVTSGGVNLREIDPKTMQSKIIDNLYLAGELLDLDGPTGGYNLQICWSTGHAAGESVCK